MVAIVGQVAESTIYKAVTEGKFPKPITILGTARGWIASEVAAWVAGRISEARQNGGV